MKLLFLFFFCINVSALYSQPAFKVIPLGVKGGADENNLSAYLIAVSRTEEFVCLDAGTIKAGLQKAIANFLIKGHAEEFLRKNIKGYLLSHGHLDHVAGLLLNSPDDSNKNIYVMPYVKDILKEKYFTDGSWINFSDEGDKPLNKYHYVLLSPATEIPLTQTNMYVTPFELSHGNPYRSTAFLLRHDEDYILYLGDTGADETERSDDLDILWSYIAPLIREKKLKAVFIECSFPDAQPDGKLFGHLRPALLMKEMDKLAAKAGNNSMESFPVVVTHIKPAGNHDAEIKQQLAAQNHLKLRIIFAEQGRELFF